MGGLESDLRLLAPGEFSANTTELVQMLNKGHHGVRLDAEAWQRINTWIDLNAPCHGTWAEVVGLDKTRNDHRRRLDLCKLYGGVVEDPEVYPETPERKIRTIEPALFTKPKVEIPRVPEWPFDTTEAQRRQALAGQTHKTIDLGDGIKIEMVFIPAGRFVMGDKNGYMDERQLAPVNIKRAFWMSKYEVTNEQYARFDPSHDSKYEHKGSWMFNEWDLGWAMNEPEQPVVRVSWKEASAFCSWLSQKTGQKVTLPSESQWEWACRAGTDTPLYYGDLDSDFSQFGNMADFTIRELVYDVRDQYTPDIVPRDARFNDKRLVTAKVGSYKPNAWGLYDMHGNVWEWTRSEYKPYQYADDAGRYDISDNGQKVARGGSWYDRPKRCRSASRLRYPPWQKVYNVGFRIVLEADDQTRQFVSNK